MLSTLRREKRKRERELTINIDEHEYSWYDTKKTKVNTLYLLWEEKYYERK